MKAQQKIDDLEWRIVDAQMRLQFGSVEQRKAAFAELSALVKQRSPERVAQMERAQGLR
jgi:hypothetical protein